MEKKVKELTSKSKGYKEQTASSSQQQQQQGAATVSTNTSSSRGSSSPAKKSQKTPPPPSTSIMLGKRTTRQAAAAMAASNDEELKDYDKSGDDNPKKIRFSKRVAKQEEKIQQAKHKKGKKTGSGEKNAQITATGCIDVMLAHNYDPEKHDPAGWLMSEKLDGVRCYWNGTTMYTRNKNQFYPPDDWKSKLPPIALDGELWTNRDDFQKIVSIVKKQDKNSDAWK